MSADRLPPLLQHPRYVPGAVLGRGAQGVVFRVEDREAKHRALVAKLWKPSTFGYEALLGEFALLSRLRLPGLVRAHDLGHDEVTGAPFLVEDFVDGVDSTTWIRRSPASERVQRLSALLAQTARTLDGLHSSGFLHGDLKPAHVRVTERSSVTLLDLGAAIARARADQGSCAVTHGFAAPEVCLGGAASIASDLYGLGAVAFHAATGSVPKGGPRHGYWRALAPWVTHAVADLIDGLLAEHPRDRPQSALSVLTALGHAYSERAGAPLHASSRTELVRTLLDASGAHQVRYVTAKSGAGKSHFARELVTEALLSGRDARLVCFPLEDAQLYARLLSSLRGSEHAWPKRSRVAALVIVDELHYAPSEFVAALDVFRASRKECAIEIIAMVREAPVGAHALELGPLRDDELIALAHDLGFSGEQAQQSVRAAEGNPGWLLSLDGRFRLSPEAICDRLATLSDEAREVLGAIAMTGGMAHASWITGHVHRVETPLSELFEAGLVTRRVGIHGELYVLCSMHMARDLAAALASSQNTLDLATALLNDSDAPPSALLSLARFDVGQRAALLHKAARRARAQGLREDETAALSALAEDAGERTWELVARLERLLRDAGAVSEHARILGFLDELAEHDERVRPLALRRRAELCAREGDHAKARELVKRAVDVARELDDTSCLALAFATEGSIALFSADWEGAFDALCEARALLATTGPLDDPEELARLDHNFGVVAMYRDDVVEALSAFERALSVKRKLGDRAGMRACLRNVGYALTRLDRYDEAERAFDQALSLARTLNQIAGQAWTLVARVELELRRGDRDAAQRFIAEAEALSGAIAGPVRADLTLCRAELYVQAGAGRQALAELSTIDAKLRSEDALVDVRALILEALSHLAVLPSERTAAGRSAVRAVRRARSRNLRALESQALGVLKQARRTSRTPVTGPHLPIQPENMLSSNASDESSLWRWLAELASGTPHDDAALALLRTVVAESGAERAFLAFCTPDRDIDRAFGVDLDGLALNEASRRIPESLLNAALAATTAVYQRAVSTPGGTGSRLAIAAAPGTGPQAVLALEHRFIAGCFDRLGANVCSRWITLAALLGRFWTSETRAPESLDRPGQEMEVPGEHDFSTVLPVRDVSRSFPSIVGHSPALRAALQRLSLALESPLPVLITGPTGAGKEVFARALHDYGPRAKAPFLAVNCGAVPDALFEAEFFGHAKGAFTGADRARAGFLARAEGGTLLLDEVGELSQVRQASLLRALETRRMRAVGSDEERPFDVRILAATNRDLRTAVALGAFRQDLLFRLNVLEIAVPALRDRVEDIPLLLESFFRSAQSKAAVTPQALEVLSQYPWPGNVRELEHLAQRLSTLGLSRIDVEHLPRTLRAASQASTKRGQDKKSPDERARSEVERALRATDGNISHAAKKLGLSRQGLKKRMTRLGMREDKAAKGDV